jgi:hypothetical protein
MKEDTDGVASAYGVLVLLQVLFERKRITSLYDLHAHTVQGLNRFMNGAMFLLIVCIFEPDARMGSIKSYFCLPDETKSTTKKSSYTKEVIIRSYDWDLRHVDYGPKKTEPNQPWSVFPT